jgi:hypothetical protein
VQRARRCSGDRHANGGCKGGPDQGHPGQSPRCGQNAVRPAEGRSAPPGSCLLRSASGDAERRF